jgi:hypothetical protein
MRHGLAKPVLPAPKNGHGQKRYTHPADDNARDQAAKEDDHLMFL